MSPDPTLMEQVRANLEALAVELARDGVPFEAIEEEVNAVFMQLGREVMGRILARFDPGDRVVDDDGVQWTRAVDSMLHVETGFGAIGVSRGLYRCVRNGPTRCFVEERAGLVAKGWTPRAARLATLLSTELTSRAAATFFQAQGGMTPSRTKLDRLPKAVWRLLEPSEEELQEDLRQAYAIPEEAVTVCVSLDGVMVKLQNLNREEGRRRARQEGRQAGGPIGSSEASVGSLSFYDSSGKRLMTRRFARMPEPDKASLKRLLRDELAEVRRRRPDLVVVAVSDGAPNNWSFLESLNPDHEIVDAYHTLEHIKRRLDVALGVGTHANQDAYARLKETLLTEDEGHRTVFRELVAIEKRQGRFKRRKTSGRGAQPTFYERHHGRMKFAKHRAMNLPIGSGVIEGTARYMVVDRLRRTGMRWLPEGGQAILSLRQYAANNEFEVAWRRVVAESSAARRARVGLAA